MLVYLDADLLLLAVDVGLDPELGTLTLLLLGLGLGLHLDLVDAGVDLDLLLLLVLLEGLGGDGDGELVGAVLEEEVLAGVHLVAVGLVVEGGHPLGLDGAGAGDLVAAELLVEVVRELVPHGDGDEVLGNLGQADVLDLN